MTNITNLTETFWNEFIGHRGVVSCSVDLSPDGSVVLSCENSNKTFKTDTYSDIPGYVKSLANRVSSVEFLTSLDRFPEWKILLRQVRQIVEEGGDIYISLNRDAYFANTNAIKPEHYFQHLMTDFSEQDLSVIDYQPYMEFLDKRTIAAICNCSEINEDEWIRIISWVGENRHLNEFIRFLHEHFYRVHALTIANHVWLKCRYINTLSGIETAEVQAPSPSENSEFKKQLHKHLQHIPCAVLWHRLSAYLNQEQGLDTQSYLSDEMSQLFRKWARQPALDQQALSIAKQWFELPGLADALEYNGVPMGDCFVYELTSDVLEFCLHAREDQAL